MEFKYPLKDNQQLFWIEDHTALLTKTKEAGKLTYSMGILLGSRLQWDEDRPLADCGLIRMVERGSWVAIDKGGDIYCTRPSWHEAAKALVRLSACDRRCDGTTHLRNDCPKG